ncbi:DNA helicase UvrD [Candidatus Micrarchaeota archaeon]|nr:DNA helicase UvrD [Candidatus Micrarchaeota archaeon]
MLVIADLHVHSKYARATSPSFDIDGLAEGAKIKGINLMATGDFTHPIYFEHLKQKLVKSEENGLFNYGGLRFILSVEVSLIYKTNEKLKKMHHILLAPSFEIAEQINERLKKYGSLSADGRPILSCTSPQLVEELMGISKEILIVPAHAWTPHFSIFGSNSGVDSVKEAFEDQADHIYAFESGLSSDPEMNWMISALDKYTIISNSDAHSKEKLGREANVFDLSELSYKSLTTAIKTRKGFVKTYEFYPEEGKYHYDGHRSCKINIPPWESKKYGNICPVCRKKLTLGVLHRVAQLADRKLGFKPENAVPFQRIVPLPTVISKAIGKSESSKLVHEEYNRLILYFGNEFAVYEAPEEQLRLATSTEISSAIIRVNKGEIKWVPGYDGVFGELVLDQSPKKKGVDKLQKSLSDF